MSAPLVTEHDSPAQNTLPPRSPVRVLHVVGQLRAGGVETWLRRVWQGIDHDAFQFDFLVHTDQPGAYDDFFLAEGCRILPCLRPARPWKYAREFQRIVRQHGPYDVIHSHVHHFSGYVLRCTAKAGILHRIAHCHSDTTAREAKAPFLRKRYLVLMERWVSRYTTRGLAASGEAARALFGHDWKQDRRIRVLYCGIDVAPFRQDVDRESLRAELGIPPGRRVVGHVGSLAPAKNHAFWLEVAAELAQRDSNLHFLLVGDGELRTRIEQRIHEEGLEQRFTLTGARQDVPRILCGAMDIFLFPSVREGLPVSMIEAQAAGLPCVYSQIITPEVVVIPPLCLRRDLAEGPDAWADAVQEKLAAARPLSREETCKLVEESEFNIRRGIAALETIYLEHQPA